MSTDIATDKAFCFLGSGSHLNSIQMVLTKQAEAAAIDANALAWNKKYLQDEGKDIQVLHSIGPLPPYPVVVNNRLDSEYNGCSQGSNEAETDHLQMETVCTIVTELCRVFLQKLIFIQLIKTLHFCGT